MALCEARSISSVQRTVNPIRTIKYSHREKEKDEAAEKQKHDKIKKKRERESRERRKGWQNECGGEKHGKIKGGNTD